MAAKKTVREQDADTIYEDLDICLKRHLARRQDPVLAERAMKIASWQSERLQRTYGDLLQTDRFGPAMEFFKTDMYGPKDYSKRDSDVKRIFPIMVKVMPGRLLHTLTYVAELNAMSMQLDEALIDALVQLDAIDNITEEAYAEAYRLCDNYELRKTQIDLVMDTGKDLEKLARKTYISGLLKIAHKPAHMMGLGELQDFLERGFSAFIHMQGAEEFLFQVRDRELKILENIYAGKADPFSIEIAPLKAS